MVDIFVLMLIAAADLALLVMLRRRRRRRAGAERLEQSLRLYAAQVCHTNI
jgi:hypothetical protein